MYSFTHVICSNRLHNFAVTPEKLCQAEFIELLDTVYENNNLNRLVVDEVRRISNTLMAMTDIKTVAGPLHIC